MRLQSHVVETVNPEQFQADGVGEIKLTNDAGEQTLTVCSDFYDMTNCTSAISVSTLLEMAHKAITMTGIPATHATAWRSAYQSLLNARQAIEYSQQLLNIESAKPYTLPVKFHVRPANISSLDDVNVEPLDFEFAPGDVTIESYFELITRLQSFHHHYNLTDEGVLEISLNLNIGLFEYAEEMCKSLVTKNTGFKVTIYGTDTAFPEDGAYTMKPHGELYVPQYLVKNAMSLAMVIQQHYGDSVQVQLNGENGLNLSGADGTNLVRTFPIVLQKLEAALMV